MRGGNEENIANGASSSPRIEDDGPLSDDPSGNAFQVTDTVDAAEGIDDRKIFSLRHLIYPRVCVLGWPMRA